MLSVPWQGGVLRSCCLHGAVSAAGTVAGMWGPWAAAAPVGSFPTAACAAGPVACSPDPLPRRERAPGAAPRSHGCIKEGQRNGAGPFPRPDGCGELRSHWFAAGRGELTGTAPSVGLRGMSLGGVSIPEMHLQQQSPENCRRSTLLSPVYGCNPPRPRVLPLVELNPRGPPELACPSRVPRCPPCPTGDALSGQGTRRDTAVLRSSWPCVRPLPLLPVFLRIAERGQKGPFGAASSPHVLGNVGQGRCGGPEQPGLLQRA